MGVDGAAHGGEDEEGEKIGDKGRKKQRKNPT